MRLKAFLVVVLTVLVTIAADPASATTSSMGNAGVAPAQDSGPTRYQFDDHVGFIVGSKLSFWGIIPAWYGWTASDPDGICRQSLGSEEYTSDYPQFGADVPPSARRARFHVVTDNGEDDVASSFVEFTLADCAGNEVSGDSEFSVDILQEDELTYTGAWQTVHARRWSGGGGRTARAVGATMTFSFWHSTGLVMPTGPTKGSFDLYVDGVYRRSVDLHRSTAAVRHVVAAVDMGNGGGDHTATLRTTTSRPVTVDAALIS